MAIKFSKKEKRDSPLTVRLAPTTIDKLKAIAKKHELNQTDIIEQLIETAYEELKKDREKK